MAALPDASATQLSLDLGACDDATDVEALPTFADCRRAAVHRWYPLVVGFSRTGASAAIAEAGLCSSDLVLDPFVGCGTTCVVAKAMGIPSLGIEAHPFLALASRVKTAWEVADVAPGGLRRVADDVLAEANERASAVRLDDAPAFVRRLFTDEVLGQLYGLRDAITLGRAGPPELVEFLLLALARAAHDATPSKIDGVYIAPTTHKRHVDPPAEAFAQRVAAMEADLAVVRRRCGNAPATIIEGDARDMRDIESGSMSLVFTSPPYLNNFDYAEMTRLEMYLLGMANSWREISQRVRSKLVMSATTQVPGGASAPLPDPHLPGHVRGALAGMASELADLRLRKGGRKSYHITVVAYFNDMLRVLQELWRVLRPGGVCRLIVGDSALYGVHVRTDDLLCQIAQNVGFDRVSCRVLRQRGHRWLLPRRTYVPLRESEVTLWK